MRAPALWGPVGSEAGVIPRGRPRGINCSGRHRERGGRTRRNGDNVAEKMTGKGNMTRPARRGAEGRPGPGENGTGTGRTGRHGTGSGRPPPRDGAAPCRDRAVPGPTRAVPSRAGTEPGRVQPVPIRAVPIRAVPCSTAPLTSRGHVGERRGGAGDWLAAAQRHFKGGEGATIVVEWAELIIVLHTSKKNTASDLSI